MSAIHVLSDILKGGSKLEKTSTPKGKNVSDSHEDAATVFAAMFSGVMNLTDSKGQNSKAGQESEEKQSAGNPVPSEQTLNGQINGLEYGNFMLANLFQPMLQSDLPAGKEANSGNDVSQGTGVIATTNAPLTNAPIASGNNFGLAMLDFASLVSDEVSASTGMTTKKPQGDNPAITELDKYRQVIANLLIELSGEITDLSLKGTQLSVEGAGTMDLRQEMTKIIQGWMAVTDEAAKNAFALRGDYKGGQAKGDGEGTKILQEGSAAMANVSYDKALGFLEALSGDSEVSSTKGNTVSSENSGVKNLRQDLAKIIQSLMAATEDGLSAGSAPSDLSLKAKISTLLAALYPKLSQGSEGTEGSKVLQGRNASAETILKQLNGTDLKLVATQVMDTALLTNVQQKSKVMGPQEGIQATEVSKGKDVNNLNSSAAVGMASNLITANVANGKTVASPVWEQISTVIREQVLSRHQALKELDIQLHPADLGKIQIGLRWENGLVHLLVQASEAATGQLLQNQLSDLRQNLMNQGVNCGSLQMGQGGERQQNHRGDESQRTFNQNTDTDEEKLIPATNPLSLGQDEINRINVTA